MEKSLTIADKVFLLAVHPTKSGFIFDVSQKLDFALSGALLLELILAKKIELENNRVKVVNTKSNDLIHEFLLQKMSKTHRNKKISTWISSFRFAAKRIRKHIQTGLVDKRIVRLEEKRFLFFNWKVPALINKQYVNKLQFNITNQIFNGPQSEEDLMLLVLIKPAGLLNRLIPEKEKRKLAGKKLDQMVKEKPVSAALEAAQIAARNVAVSVAATSAAARAGHS